ncbi:MAG: hypothetical protein LBD46_02835 [Endomicrobium sp.]|jgi:hemolysin activation/secretion protein|nr:hypothetical protein [Endomicrobium sp.]
MILSVNVKGNKTTSENYLQRYLFLGNAGTFNADITNQNILNFNASNDARMRIALSPGEVFGTSIVDIVVDEPNRYSFSAFIDNYEQKETGKIRYGGYAAVRSLTGYRDILNAGGVFSLLTLYLWGIT